MLSSKKSQHILKTCPLPQFIMKLGEDDITANKGGCKENSREEESWTACRNGKVETMDNVGRTETAKEADGRTDSIRIEKDKLCEAFVKH